MSKHELDCPLSTIDSDVDAKDCVFCPIARAAYQRGREDAAKAIEDDIAKNGDAYGIGSDHWHCCFRENAIAAARGDGEQA